MIRRHLSRRDFLKTSAVSGGIATVGRLASSSVLGANDRLNLGFIGLGNMGSHHLKNLMERVEEDNVRCTAVCDVYQKRVSRAVDVSKAEGYLDYRKLLERKDVDAVLVATPDHWHSEMAVNALEAGKHVYLEKPMTLTIEQALEVRDAVKRYGRVLQVGVNDTAKDLFRQARQAIQSGRIGKVTWAQASYNRNARVCSFNAFPFEIEASAGPEATGEDYIDWDMWLGHEFGLAPRIPFNAEHFFRFRKYWSYSGGVATDLLYHRLAPLLVAIAGPDGEHPLRATAMGGLYVEKDGRDIPDTFLMTVDYPSEYSIFLVSTLTNDTQLPSRIYGKYGTMDVSDDIELRFNGQFESEFKARNDGYREVRISGDPGRDLLGNFVDVIRGNGSLHCNSELGAATMVAIKLAVDSYRKGRTLMWDHQREQVTG